MIPLMENKMKWDRPKKKKKYSSANIEIEMTDINYLNVGNAVEDEEPMPAYQKWYGKHNGNTPSPSRRGVPKEHNPYLHSGDSGIESVQASPAQKTINNNSSTIEMYDLPGPSTSRHFNSVYLHPDRALSHHSNAIAGCSRDGNSIEDMDQGDGGDHTFAASFEASSLTSMPDATGSVHSYREDYQWDRRRRSSTWTGRYSDKTDPEFENLRLHQTRGSVGMHSLSDSLNKLTFTQSLAFPELARKLATRRRQEQLRAAINDTSQEDFEACSKFIAVAGVFLLSLMVYGVVNKYSGPGTAA